MRRLLVALACLGVLLPAGARAEPLFGGAYSRPNEDATGEGGNGQSRRGSVSADGRFVAFLSESANLVPDDSNGVADAFVKDRLSGAIERVSVSSAGAQADAEVTDAAISGDGVVVALVTEASTLVDGDTNARADVFVHDRASGTTELVSVAAGGGPADHESADVAVSHDGGIVAFASRAQNLGAGDADGFGFDVFARDRSTGTTEQLTTASPLPGIPSFDPTISADGSIVAFTSAEQLLPIDVDFGLDVYVADRTAGALSVINAVSTPDSLEHNFGAALAAEGRFIAFVSTSQLVTRDTDSCSMFLPDLNCWDIYVHDLATGTTSLESVTAMGEEGHEASSSPSLSADGRLLTFDSYSEDYGASRPGSWDVFLRDRETGDVQGISYGAEQAPSGFGQPSEYPTISADGSIVAFQSSAGDLAPGDDNGALDVIVYRWCSAEPAGALSSPSAQTVAPRAGALSWETEDAACNALAPMGL